MKLNKQLVYIVAIITMVFICNNGYCNFADGDWDEWITITPQKIESMIKNGENVNATDKDKHTPLMKAASRSTPEIINILIKNGAYVNAKDEKQGWTPIMYAAASNPNPLVIETLIEQGANVNATDDNGATALIQASMNPTNSNPKIVETLIKHGADVNAKTNLGTTALILAASKAFMFYNMTDNGDNIEIIRILLQHGADANAKDNEGYSALSFAKESDNPQKDEIIKLLKEYGAK